MLRRYDFDSTPVEDRPLVEQERLEGLYRSRSFAEIAKWIAANGDLIYNDGPSRFPDRHRFYEPERYNFLITKCEMEPVSSGGWKKYYTEECLYGGAPIGIPYIYPRPPEHKFPCFNGHIKLGGEPFSIFAQYRDALAAIGIHLGSGGHNRYEVFVFAQDFWMMNKIQQRRIRERQRRYLISDITRCVGWREFKDFPRSEFLKVDELDSLYRERACKINSLKKLYNREGVRLTEDPATINHIHEVERIKHTLAAAY